MLRGLHNAWERVRAISSSQRAQPVEETPPPEVSEPAADGQVAVRDGVISIANPMDGGLLPVLVPGPDVILTVDGEELTAPVAVWEGKNVTVAPRAPAHTPVRDFRIRVAPDALAAFLELSPPGPPGYRVIDQGPAHVLHLKAQPLPGRQSAPTQEAVEQALAEAGVVAGIDPDAIRLALSSEDTPIVPIATATPPVPSQPARAETAVRNLAGGDPAALAQRVRPGQLVARLHPARAGQPGVNVLGQTLEPDPVRPVALAAGPRVQLASGGLEAIAVAAGRPRLIETEPGRIQVSVVPVTEVSVPLTPQAEPYCFEGDVVVQGPVKEGVTIQATGWIWVQGPVTGAVLDAEQGIRVDEGAVRSQLRTGGLRSGLQFLRRQYGEMLRDLDLLRNAATQVMEHPRYAHFSGAASVRPVVQLLAENRFRHLHNGIDKCRKTLRDQIGLRPPVDLEAVLNTLEHHLYGGGTYSFDDLGQAIDAVRAAAQWLDSATAGAWVPAPVRAGMLLRSDVQASGGVTVDGRGAEKSMVVASGQIQVPTARSTYLQSESSIDVGLAVAPETDETLMEVPPGGRIRVGVAVGRVTLQVGRWRHALRDRLRDVWVESDASGLVTATAGGRQLQR